MSCPAKVAVPPTWWGSGIPGYLSCVLEEGHEGQHVDVTGMPWELMPYTVETIVPLSFDLGPHPNCSCALPGPLTPSLPVIDSSVRLPGWWVAQMLDEVFGPVSPVLFHPGP